MSNLTKRALRVFNVLENYREGSEDILDALLPFFEQIFEEMDKKIFDTEAFSARVKELYHWNFSIDITEEFVPNFVNRGWLKKVSKSSSNAAYIVTCPANDRTSQPIQEDAARMLTAIAIEFHDFIRNISPLTAFNRTPEELSDILIEWLVSADAYSEDILEYSVHSGLKDDGKLALIVDIPDNSILKTEEKYLAARFVKKLIDDNSPYTKDLCRIASIGLLTEVVQDFQHPVSRVEKTDLCIYLDAPIAMDLLGVSGKASKENILSLLGELEKIGGRLFIFQSSIDEIKGALAGVLKRDASERNGPTANAMRRNEVLLAFVRGVAGDPGLYLGKLGVEIDERTLNQNPASHSFFSTDNYEDLMSRLTFHLDISRKEHDASAVALIMRLRRNTQSRDLFSSKFIFLTRNGMFTQFSNKYCRDNKITDVQKVGPVIHQRQLATAIWLRTGLNTSSGEIPKRYILSACERVLDVKNGLIEAVKKASSNLTEEQAKQLDLLLSEDRSVQHLQDKTLGLTSVVSSSDGELLLATLEEGLVADLKKESDQKIDKLQKEKNKIANSAKVNEDNSAEEISTYEKALSELDTEDREIIGNTIERAENYGATCKKIIKLIVCIIFVIVGLFLGFGPILKAGILKNALTVLVTAIIPTIMYLFSVFDRKFGLNRVSEFLMQKRFRKLIERNQLQTKLEKYPLVFDGLKISIDETPKARRSP